ncbi:MAG TPA: OmpH family outer membrane protein [Candidatus Acidoferrum sp.]|nr:OmpH family outer membrane protein [Candidatus Acidoferrum sp.]
MHSISVLRVAALILACLLGTTVVPAQSAPSGAATKIGVINILQAISVTAEGKQAAAQLDAQFAPRQKELETLEKQVNDLQQRLSAGATTLNEQERARITAQGTRLAQRLDRKRNEYQEDVSTAQREVVDGIGRKMMDVLNRFAQENNYVAVFDSSVQNSPILYVAKNLDITQDVIRLYDQAYPAKAAGAVPANKPTPAPKPATPPSPKPQ